MKVKVFIIPDLHIWDRNISGRKDYKGELKEYWKQIEKIIFNAISEGFEVIIIFAGDIFHAGTDDKKETLYWFKKFTKLAEVAGLFLVVGNHELTFSEDNPVWDMVKEIQSPSLKKYVNYLPTALGETSILNVMDRFSIGNTTFHLFHNPVDISVPVLQESLGYYNVGIFHHNVIDYEIGQTMRNKYGIDPLEEHISYSKIRNMTALTQMDLAFNGHMHKASGRYNIKLEDHTTILWYLASIGRTNRNEIADSNLDRDIPYVIVEENQQPKIGFEIITLRDWAHTLDKEQVEDNKLKYEKVKEKKRIRTENCASDNPYKDMKEYSMNDKHLALWLPDLEQGLVPKEIQNIKDRVNQII